MTPFKPIIIVISLYEIFIEGMEYDDTFQTFSHLHIYYTQVTMRKDLKAVIVLHPLNKYFIQ
jgi:uncharacterized membrane protein YqhA